MHKRSSGELHGKTLPAVHNRLSQLMVDSASRANSSWPRLKIGNRVTTWTTDVTGFRNGRPGSKYFSSPC